MKKKLSIFSAFILTVILFTQSILHAREVESLKDILGDEEITYRLLQEKQAKLMQYCNDNFKDYKSYKWYGKTVAMMVGTGKVGGYPDGTLRLDQNITHAEVLKVLLADEEFDKEVREGEKWYDSIIRYALEKEVIKKDPYYDMSKYDYNQPATRMNIARYIYNYLGLRKSNKDIVFEDVNEIDGKIVQALYDELLITGYEENNKRYYKPTNTITRAEAFTMLINLIGYREDKEAYKEEKLKNKEEELKNKEEELKNKEEETKKKEEELKNNEEKLKNNEEQIPKEEQKENNKSSELTQEQFDLLYSYVPYDEEERQDFIYNYGKENMSKFVNIAKNYMDTTYNFDYRMDFETYYNRALPYSTGTYNDRVWFKNEYDTLAKYKFIIEVKFLTDEYFVYDRGPDVIGLLLFRVKSAEGDFRKEWFGEYNYELGKWYQVPYIVHIGTGQKGEAFVNYYGNGFKPIGPVMPVEGD